MSDPLDAWRDPDLTPARARAVQEQLAPRYRLPEPVRRADRLAGASDWVGPGAGFPVPAAGRAGDILALRVLARQHAGARRWARISLRRSRCNGVPSERPWGTAQACHSEAVARSGRRA